MPKSARVWLLLIVVLSALSSASARPLHHETRTGHKTHRLVAGSKAVRINSVGEVITKQP